MYRSGIEMKKKFSNFLRLSSTGLKCKHSVAVNDADSTRLSSMATERSLSSFYAKRLLILIAAGKEVSTVDSPTNNIPKPPLFYDPVVIVIPICLAYVFMEVHDAPSGPNKDDIFNRIARRIQNDDEVQERIGYHISVVGNWKTQQKWIDDDGNEHIVANFDIRGSKRFDRVHSEMLKDKVEKEWKYTYLMVEAPSPSPAKLNLVPGVTV